MTVSSAWNSPMCRLASLHGAERISKMGLERCSALELVLESPGVLLEESDAAKTFVVVVDLAVALGRQHVRVCPAYVAVAVGVLRVSEVRHAVRTQERERVELRELVPHLFQADRGRGVALPPEDVDHLAVGADRHLRATLRGDGALDDATDMLLEPRPVRHAVDHERRERLGGIQDRELARGAGALDVERRRLQRTVEQLAMVLRRDDDHWLAPREAGSDEVRDRRREEVVVLVELDDVVCVGGVSEELARARCRAALHA